MQICGSHTDVALALVVAGVQPRTWYLVVVVLLGRADRHSMGKLTKYPIGPSAPLMISMQG